MREKKRVGHAALIFDVDDLVIRHRRFSFNRPGRALSTVSPFFFRSRRYYIPMNKSRSERQSVGSVISFSVLTIYFKRE